MSPFADPEAALRARARLEEIGGGSLDGFFDDAFAENPAPDAALTNLERWLQATSNAGIHLQQVIDAGPLGKLLMTLLGSSQPIADSLIQNPELASLVLDPTQVSLLPTRAGIVEEGSRMLAASSSHSHALDRLRFLKQRWNLGIVVNDLAGTWAQPQVWLALSELAEALIELAARLAAQENSSDPVAVIAFGKLGGCELNYSSDVDLVYVAPDGLDMQQEQACSKFCEALGRALTVRMGRGWLYRVDLRLRPYGAAGPIVRSVKGYEAYYQAYAEPWEVLALLRSRPIVGPAEIAERWERMRETTCFRPRLSEVALEQILAMKSRIQDSSADDDLKRGAGGIRDVEFLTQVLQLVNGHGRPELQVRPTLDAIAALDAAGILEHSVALALAEGYVFLRRLEHRTQLVGDRQTHSIPASSQARESLARMMGLGSWKQLEAKLSFHRRTIQTLYQSTLQQEDGPADEREAVRGRLGSLGPAALQWFDVLPESASYYEGLLANEGSLRRVETILAFAPRLVPNLKASLPLTENLLSGEIEEAADPAARIGLVADDEPLETLADAVVSANTATIARWVLTPDFDLNAEITRTAEAVVAACLRRLGARLDVIGLGSFGNMEMGPDSDIDLLFLTHEPERHAEAEATAQRFLGLIGRLKRLGSPFDVDLRLRPEGGKGMLARTFEGFRTYDLHGMEMWERFALGHARLVAGSPKALALVLESAYFLPLTPERLQDLVSMKRRVETERVLPQHLKRQVKLGHGGLNDIEWLVHLIEMRYPTATDAGTTTDMEQRIRNVGRAQLINAFEVELLIEARRHLLDVRTRLYLLGLSDDLVPENPDKLNRLAASCGLEDANAFLARHEPIVEAVRRMLLEGLERLRA